MTFWVRKTKNDEFVSSYNDNTFINMIERMREMSKEKKIGLKFGKEASENYMAEFFDIINKEDYNSDLTGVIIESHKNNKDYIKEKSIKHSGPKVKAYPEDRSKEIKIEENIKPISRVKQYYNHLIIKAFAWGLPIFSISMAKMPINSTFKLTMVGLSVAYLLTYNLIRRDLLNVKKFFGGSPLFSKERTAFKYFEGLFIENSNTDNITMNIDKNSRPTAENLVASIKGKNMKANLFNKLIEFTGEDGIAQKIDWRKFSCFGRGCRDVFSALFYADPWKIQ